MIRVDPTGQIDDYFANADGSTLVVRNEQPNRYFNENTETGAYDRVSNISSAKGKKYLDSNPAIAQDLAKESNNSEKALAGGS
jgi:hypothetical protein